MLYDDTDDPFIREAKRLQGERADQRTRYGQKVVDAYEDLRAKTSDQFRKNPTFGAPVIGDDVNLTDLGAHHEAWYDIPSGERTALMLRAKREREDAENAARAMGQKQAMAGERQGA